MLPDVFQTLNVDTLVICGVSTSGCVRASTLDAMQYGFRPMVSNCLVLTHCSKLTSVKVVGSACGDRTPEVQKANLFDLGAKYADIVSEEEATKNLQRKWRVL